jgi:hypothetical protein
MIEGLNSNQVKREGTEERERERLKKKKRACCGGGLKSGDSGLILYGCNSKRHKR